MPSETRRIAMNDVLDSFAKLFQKLEVYADNIEEPYNAVIGTVTI
ncbi:MAG TPA: hypothetical protein VHO70_13935 [Chitinispirillaceae bacterium]|nr:hypothetical protein [Chitinispirillaceae bacterium]